MRATVKNFCIDIDNVIAQTDRVMRRVIADYTGNRVQLVYEDVQEYNYYDCKDKAGNGISDIEWQKVHELFSEPRYLWLIEPTSGAVEGLHRLAEHGTLHLATSRMRKARTVTVEWLDNHGFPPHELHFIKHGEKHACLHSFSAAVEDDYKQAKAFASSAKTPCFLLRHPWNRTKPVVKGLHWVDTWPELTDRLLALKS